VEDCPKEVVGLVNVVERIEVVDCVELDDETGGAPQIQPTLAQCVSPGHDWMLHCPEMQRA
jgi:hypothetical protein